MINNSDTEAIISLIENIKLQYPDNLMAKYFDAEYFRHLDPKSRQRLRIIINTGIKNADSHMGAYAMHGDDYDQFSKLIEAMIRDYHNISPDVEISHKHDWDVAKNPCDLATIDSTLAKVSMRVRVARNVKGFPLPGAMDKKQRVEFEDLVVKALQTLIKDSEFGGEYFSLTPDSAYKITQEEYNKRIKAHQMFKDMSGDRYLDAAGISNDWPYGRGMYVSQKEDFLIWVGEEDHLRIITMQKGNNLNSLFKRLHKGVLTLSKLLPEFISSPKYGYVTSCPTNLGGGMRASLHIFLPKITENDVDLLRTKSLAKLHGLSVRGIGGEHSDAGEGGLVDLSPIVRLGITEVEIMTALYNGVAALFKEENAS